MNRCVSVPPVRGSVTVRLSAALTIALLVCATASAQTPSNDRRDRLKEGQKISVTDEQGRELRGRIVRLTPDAVTVSGREGREEVQYAALVKIDTVDDLKNGALIGMGVGLTLFALEAAIARGDGITLNPTGYIVFGLMYGGLGAGAGAGLDALIGGNRNIYQRGSAAARFSLTPAVGPDRVRAAVRISW